MIQIKRVGSKLTFTFDTEKGYTISTDWEASSGLYALLLGDQLQKVMGDSLSSIRRAAYEAGYKDGRGRKTKQTWFSRLWNT